MPEFRTASGLVSCTPYMRTAGGLVKCSTLFFGQSGPVESGGSEPLTASASPSYVSGAIAQNGSDTAVTNATTVTVSGGKPPYSYAWTADGGLSPTNPNNATTGFTGMVAPGQERFGDGVCTVTDAAGQTVTASVTVSVSNYGSGNAQL